MSGMFKIPPHSMASGVQARASQSGSSGSPKLHELRAELQESHAADLLELGDKLSIAHEHLCASFGSDPKAARDDKPMDIATHNESRGILSDAIIIISAKFGALSPTHARKILEYFSYEGNENLTVLTAIAQTCDRAFVKDVMQAIESVFYSMKGRLLDEGAKTITYASEVRGGVAETFDKNALLVDFILLTRQLHVISQSAYARDSGLRAWALLSELEGIEMRDSSVPGRAFTLLGEQARPAEKREADLPS